MEIDLKAPGATARLKPLITSADVVIEQFRPGVMHRLGLGYGTMRTLNPGLIYCSITGFASGGALANVAGHDMNYQGRMGMLALSARGGGAPTFAPALIADIGGGSYPAVIISSSNMSPAQGFCEFLAGKSRTVQAIGTIHDPKQTGSSRRGRSAQFVTLDFSRRRLWQMIDEIDPLRVFVGRKPGFA